MSKYLRCSICGITSPDVRVEVHEDCDVTFCDDPLSCGRRAAHRRQFTVERAAISREKSGS